MHTTESSLCLSGIAKPNRPDLPRCMTAPSPYMHTDQCGVSTHTLASTRIPNQRLASGLHQRRHATRKTLLARMKRLARHPTTAAPFGQGCWGLQGASGVSKTGANDSAADYCYQCQNQLAGWETRHTHTHTHTHTHSTGLGFGLRPQP
jgi:hypothetical protein